MEARELKWTLKPTPPAWKCETHGAHHKTICFRFPEELDRAYCLLCIFEKMQALGIQQMQPNKDGE